MRKGRGGSRGRGSLGMNGAGFRQFHHQCEQVFIYE